MIHGVIVYAGEVVPDKKLIKTTTYRYYPSSDMREQIIRDVKLHLKSDIEDVIVDIDINIDLKEYDVKPEKKFWYDKLKPNDPKNT